MKITNVLQSILDGSIREPNKMWVDKSDECYNREIKSQLQNNDIEMHSTHKEGKAALPE